MLNLQLANAFVDIQLNRSQFDAGLRQVIAQLSWLRGMGQIDLKLNRGAATSSLNLLQQQLNALKSSANVNVTVRRNVIGGGGGGGGAPGLGMGLAQGLGIAGFAANPAMMAGQVIGSGLRDAVSTAMELQSTFIDLQRASGETSANIDKFKGTLFEISTQQAGVSFKDLTDIAQAGAKAGITDKEGIGGLETFTRGMAKVRNSVQGIGTEQLANDMTRMLNLFHKGTEYVESFGSVLTRMDNISTSSAGDILEMSKSLSGTFASLSLTIPQVMAFSSVLADVGLTNQQGASSFSQILRMLASESEKFAVAIGMPVQKFQQAVKTDALGALKLLIDKFKEINEVDPIKAQEFISGLGFRGVKTAGALQQLASMIDDVAKRTAMANDEERTHGSLLAANALNSDKAEGSVQKFKNAMLELASVIGEKFIPAVTAAAGFATLAAKLSINKGGKSEEAHMEALRAIFGGTLMLEGEKGDQQSAKATTLYQKLFGNDPEAQNKELAKAAAAKQKAAGTDREKQLAAIDADNAARKAADAERRTRLIPTDEDRAAAGEEVGALGAKASDKEKQEHADTVFRHAQRIQGERQAAEAADTAAADEAARRTRIRKMAEAERADLDADRGRNGDQTANRHKADRLRAEADASVGGIGKAASHDVARQLGEDIKRFGGMALGTLFAKGEEKAGIAAGLAEKGINAFADAAGNPLDSAKKALKGVGPTEADIEAALGPRKAKFQSQTFSSGDDFARSFIQEALSGKEDTGKEQVKKQEETNKILTDIAKDIKPKAGDPNGAPVFRR